MNVKSFGLLMLGNPFGIVYICVVYYIILIKCINGDERGWGGGWAGERVGSGITWLDHCVGARHKLTIKRSCDLDLEM